MLPMRLCFVFKLTIRYLFSLTMATPAQLNALDNLLESVVGENSFYTEKFANADLSSLESIPLTTKEEWVSDQLANPPYGTNLTFPLSSYTRFCQTSGTTGEPMRWLDTPDTWDGMLQNWSQIYEAAGVEAGHGIFFAFSFGPFLGFWTAFDAATRMGCLTIPGGGFSSSMRLKVILDNQVDVLCCTPTYALHLGQVATAQGIDLANGSVRVIIVAGEPGGNIPETRETIESLWGARVYDHHGMTEVGPVTIPSSGGLRVIDSAYIAEVRDPETGEMGVERGELILTTLGRIGSPLIRYRTGDLVEMAPDGLLRGGILGRLDDMIIVRGVNIWPSAVEAVVRRVGGVAEYQVRVKQAGAMNELELDVEPERNTPPGVGARVALACRETFALRIPVREVETGSLPRFELKAKRWVYDE